MSTDGMIRTVARMVVFGAMTGCATSPIGTSEATDVPEGRIIDASALRPSAGSVPVVVKRDSGMMGAACGTKLYVNGSHVADLRTSEKVTLQLKPGEHNLAAVPGGICGGAISEVRATIKAGAPQTFRIGAGQSGDMTLSPTSF
jgi:hypothetical protein